jgi:hypothetical protein
MTNKNQLQVCVVIITLLLLKSMIMESVKIIAQIPKFLREWDYVAYLTK